MLSDAVGHFKCCAALEDAAQLETMFLEIRDVVNAEHGLYVAAAPGKPVKLLKPALKPQQLSMTCLKQLLAETCQGVQDADLLKVRISNYTDVQARGVHGMYISLYRQPEPAVV